MIKLNQFISEMPILKRKKTFLGCLMSIFIYNLNLTDKGISIKLKISLASNL